MLKYLSSALVASGGVVKTSLGTITLPAGSKALLGAWIDPTGGLGATTLQNVSGLFEMESPDINIQPCQIPIPGQIVLGGTGGSSMEQKVWPMNAAVKGTERLTGYVTMNNAQTIVPQCRWGVVVDVVQ